MKILIGVHHFPPKFTGGVELVTSRRARWLAQKGHEVSIVCIESLQWTTSQSIDVATEETDGFRVFRLHLNLVKDGFYLKTRFKDAQVHDLLTNILEEIHPDIYHAESCYLITASPIEAAYSAGIPVVVSLHDYWFVCPLITLMHPDGNVCDGAEVSKCAWCLATEQRRYRILDKVSYGISRRFATYAIRRGWLPGWPHLKELQEREVYLKEQLKHATAIVTPSRYMWEVLSRQEWPTGQLHLIEHSLEDIFLADESSEFKNDGRFRIGYLGNIFPAKGVHILIEAFKLLLKQYSNLELKIYGDPKTESQYQNRLAQLTNGVEGITFGGKFTNHEVGDLLKNIDVLVVPSLWYEIGPLVTLEAFAARVPVVASRIPNMTNQIEHEVNGLLFEVGNSEDLANQLKRIIENPDFFHRLKANIKKVRELSDEMNDMMNIYNKVLAKKIN